MSSRSLLFVACACFALTGMTAPAHAQTGQAGTSINSADGIPKRTQAAVKEALLTIGADSAADAKLMDLVRAHDSAKVRAMLIQYGVRPGELRNVVVDALGSSQGPRILNPLTIYFDVIPQGGNVPEPVGMVYLGPGIGWVEWDDFVNSWFWW